MVVIEQQVKRDVEEVNFLQEYLNNERKFFKFNYRKDNCSNTVKKFLEVVGVSSDRLTPWADTIRSLGNVNYSPSSLRVGDIVAMGRPGDTHHVGVYMGGNAVLHQSRVRGLVVGVYNDLNAFINHRAGFYFVRPKYPVKDNADVINNLVASVGSFSAPFID
jgi:hypothetical protein